MKRLLDQIVLWFLSITMLTLALLSVGLTQLPGYLLGLVIAMVVVAGAWLWRQYRRK